MESLKAQVLEAQQLNEQLRQNNLALQGSMYVRTSHMNMLEVLRHENKEVRGVTSATAIAYSFIRHSYYWPGVRYSCQTVVFLEPILCVCRYSKRSRRTFILLLLVLWLVLVHT